MGADCTGITATCGAGGLMITVAVCAPGTEGDVILIGLPLPTWITPGPKICAESWGANPSVIRINRKPENRFMRKVYAFPARWQQNNVYTYKNFSLVTDSPRR